MSVCVILAPVLLLLDDWIRTSEICELYCIDVGNKKHVQIFCGTSGGRHNFGDVGVEGRKYENEF